MSATIESLERFARDIFVAAGVDEGTRIRLSGEGEAGEGKGFNAGIDIKEMQKEAETYLKQGFTMFKSRFGYGPAHGTKGVSENLKAVEERMNPLAGELR